jgi:glycosyltransferase involved in cell wall biosynthesis
MPLNNPTSSVKRVLLSVVVPCYNERDLIDIFMRSLTAVFQEMPQYDLEVIFVDDGSVDGTSDVLISLCEKDSRVKVAELSRNFGKEAALTAGINLSSGDAVIPIDADLQDPPELIPLLVTEWEKGAEVVLARRADRTSDSFLKRKTAELFYYIHNRVSEIRIPSNVGDFRLMDRCVVDCLNQLPEHQRFMKGLFAWVGFKTVVVDYKRKSRKSGTSKFSGWRLWNFAVEGITSFSSTPLKVWTYFGAFSALVTFSYACYIVMRTLIRGVDVPGYASLLVAVLFFGSVQLIGIGVLGEYIARIFSETKRRPIYIIRKRYGCGKHV